jgi:WD40 repeat protein
MVQPSIVNRLRRERITALAVCRSVFAIASKDFSVVLWQLNGKEISQMAFEMKHQAMVKLMTISPKLKMCVSVDDDGLLLAVSSVSGRFIHGIDLHESEPSLLAVSDFGFIAVAFNRTDGCVIHILDQNLRQVYERKIPETISCWKLLNWSDGGDYLLSVLSNDRLVLIKLPFVDIMDLDIGHGPLHFVDFVENPMRIVLISTAGKMHWITV